MCPFLIDSKKPAISIVIPVYNAARYVAQCLDSLVEQTFRDFEVIAVNDGSTDGSLDILRYYERKYPYFHVIDQKNGGVSRARNAGMAQARGEYLGFMDADDTAAPTYLERLYRTCVDNNAEIACCYYYYRFEEPSFLFQYPFRCHGVYNRTQAMNKLLHDTQIQGLMWNKLFLRSLFTDNNITFPAMKCLEDMIVMNQLFAHINRLAVIDEPLYYYTQHKESALGSINASKINDFMKAMVMVRLMLERGGQYEKYRRSYQALIRKTGVCCYLYVLRLHGREKCMQGCVRNLRALYRGFRYCTSEEFSPTAKAPELADQVVMPGRLEKDYYTIR